ncbi:MAG: LPXTG cell wall anchor domain-containing protein [Actinomycetota bacterium]|nr:LPXTG cell wall anchor domain-containing protein [Actinomycetota bacterium]
MSDSSPAPGQTVDLVIDGFLPDSQVSVVLRSDPIALGTFTADGDGVLRTSVVIPAGVAAGSHSIVASGVNAANEPVTATIAITVAAVGSGALPSTGGDIAAVLTVSVALLAAGIASMLVGRRRRGAPS